VRRARKRVGHNITLDPEVSDWVRALAARGGRWTISAVVEAACRGEMEREGQLSVADRILVELRKQNALLEAQGERVGRVAGFLDYDLWLRLGGDDAAHEAWHEGKDKWAGQG
jgi:hypothetical protein